MLIVDHGEVGIMNQDLEEGNCSVRKVEQLQEYDDRYKCIS